LAEMAAATIIINAVPYQIDCTLWIDSSNMCDRIRKPRAQRKLEMT
jgi:hypothetical protein